MAKIDTHAYLASTPFSEGMANRDNIVATMSRFDIEAILLVSKMSVDCDVLNGNKQLKKLVSVSDGIYAYVAANADYPELSIEQLRAYLTRPEFVGTVFATPAGRSLLLDEVREIVNAQRRYGKPLVFQARNLADVNFVRSVAEAFPTLSIVLLGMGGDDWRSAVEAAKRFVNIHLAISGSLDSDKISYAYSLIAARRLLFGSGLPFAEPTIFENLINESSVLTTSDRRRIFRQNASGLFHINE
jgi:predicted TIM-barrel fold metal-dependent hydrolase